MIVVDSSALIEIIRDGRRAEACVAALEGADPVLISAGTMAETLIVAIGHSAERPLISLFERFGLDVMPVTEERAKAVARAYRRYGKGWHPAGLNFGDCFAYGLAKELNCPLLFIGGDFAQTDIEPALD